MAAMSTFRRDIIVVGASLGGIEALTRLFGSLPADLRAAVFVVLHMEQSGPNQLPRLLSREPKISIASAVDGDAIVIGRAYVAVPGMHLMIQENRVRLSRGPRECHSRPSIDVLFRSAAYELERRAIGIVLTGLLDDGTAGLWAIKDRGGVAIVQSPAEAPYPSMPLSALKHVAVDHTLEVAKMAAALVRLTSESLVGPENTSKKREQMRTEVNIALGETTPEGDFAKLGVQSFFTCPQCHGSMIRIDEGSN